MAQNTNPVTPVEVLVHFSESSVFPFAEKSYSFEEFEFKAALAASYATEFYDKTKITVKFANDMEYTCNLDIAAHDKKGFRDHCDKVIKYSQTEEGLDFYTRIGLMDCINFLKSIVWPD